MKILITGGNNSKALKLLKAFPGHFILFADYGSVPGMITDNYAFSSIGELNKDSIAHILLNFCITEAVDSIIPLHHFEVEPIAKSAVLFGEYGIDVLLPSLENLHDFLSGEKSSGTNFSIFIKGNCIYTSGEKHNLKTAENLNGVFYSDNNKDFKLFTI
ncbi:hypothetical protein [Pedobacter rhodius]|uniref:Uncharacterized protein n=1 Tax=Pedobacter rhodius TaxID=3004098 RepID=A0ABT4KWT9_9SPHI|nr:hypothetical protein [Pedobacter sp. SJ11]MCZ4223386.1 hypothetical protein [Pedobacter sp. SJ11]